MTPTPRPLTFLLILAAFLLVATFVGGGCAATHGGGHRDVHASATLGAGPRMLVAGPARLLHIDVSGRNDVVLYAVARGQGTDADCASGPTGAPVHLRGDASSRIDLAVASDRAICAGPATARTSILWHARKTDGALADGEKLAMQTRNF